MLNSELKWIKAGTKLFAENGVNGLKVELIAKEVGISKSSFYHHFADVELFIDRLLEYHITQYKIISEKEYQCKRLKPELIKILIECKTDLLFNRQLRVNRSDKRFSTCLEKTSLIAGPAFIQAWKNDLELSIPSHLIDKLFTVIREAFYLQINKHNMTEAWIFNYFTSVKDLFAGLAATAKKM